MPTTGHLFLRANLSDDLTVTGAGFKVTIKPLAAPTTTSTVPTTPAVPVATLVSPATYASIPRRVGDQSGDPGDMVNFSLIGTQAQVQAAYPQRRLGCRRQDHPGRRPPRSALHPPASGLRRDAHEHPSSSSAARRTSPSPAPIRSWSPPSAITCASGRPTRPSAGRPLWVGSCTHDIGFERDQRNGGTTHKIDPDIDLERTFLLNSFNAAGDLSSAAYVLPTDPLTTARTATGGSFHSDGRILVLDLNTSLQ